MFGGSLPGSVLKIEKTTIAGPKQASQGGGRSGSLSGGTGPPACERDLVDAFTHPLPTVRKEEAPLSTRGAALSNENFLQFLFF